MLSDLKTKPARVFSLFEMAFAVYKKSFLYIVAVCLFVYIPMYIVVECVPEQYLLTNQDILNQNMDEILIYMYISIGIFIVFKPLATAALTCVCQRNVEGQALNFPVILDNSLLKWRKLVLSSLVFAALISLCSFTIVLPVFCAVYLAFFINVIAVSDKWGFGAMLYSARLVKGRWWLTAFIITLTGLLSAIITMGVFYFPIVLNAPLNVLVSTGISVLNSYFSIVLMLYFLNVYYMNQNIKEA